jgi:hypothetical protein
LAEIIFAEPGMGERWRRRPATPFAGEVLVTPARALMCAGEAGRGARARLLPCGVKAYVAAEQERS